MKYNSTFVIAALVYGLVILVAVGINYFSHLGFFVSLAIAIAAMLVNGGIVGATGNWFMKGLRRLRGKAEDTHPTDKT
jgi:hypothetical protein